MAYTENLTRSLLARALDIMQAVKHIGTVKQVLKDARSNIDTQSLVIYEVASRCEQKYDVTVNILRRCSIQTTHANRP